MSASRAVDGAQIEDGAQVDADPAEQWLTSLLPLPAGAGAHADAAEAAVLGWLRAFRVLPDERTVRAFAAVRSTALAATVYPHARGEDLVVVAQAVSWTLPFDDLMSKLRDERRTMDLLTPFLTIVRGEPAHGAGRPGGEYAYPSPYLLAGPEVRRPELPAGTGSGPGLGAGAGGGTGSGSAASRDPQAFRPNAGPSAAMDEATAARLNAAAAALAAALAELWPRVNEGMSAVWQDRFRRDWMAYLRAHLTESRHRAEAWLPTIEEYEAARRDSIAADLAFDLIERAGRFEVPALVRGCVPMREMTAAASNVFVYLNDLVSANVEAAAGDSSGNILLLTAARLGCTPAEAAPIVRRRIAEQLAAFDAARADLARAGEYEALDPVERAAAERFVAGLRNFAAGFLHWGLRSERYQVRRNDGGAGDSPSAA